MRVVWYVELDIIKRGNFATRVDVESVIYIMRFLFFFFRAFFLLWVFFYDVT